MHSRNPQHIDIDDSGFEYIKNCTDVPFSGTPYLR